MLLLFEKTKHILQQTKKRKWKHIKSATEL